MEQLGQALDTLLNVALLPPWAYTVSRAVMLMAILLTLWRGRRYAWILASMGLASLIIACRVLADVILGGASTPFTVYAFVTNTATLLIYITMNHFITGLTRRKGVETQAAVYLAQRESARATVDSLKRQHGLSPTIWPEDKI